MVLCRKRMEREGLVLSPEDSSVLRDQCKWERAKETDMG